MNRIVHLGLGAFHRAHQAVYTTDAGDGWEICGVARRSREVVDALRGSDGRYTLVERGPSSDSTRALRVAEALVAADEPGAVVARIASPDTHIVTLTITEGGYERGNPLLELLARGVAARDGRPLAVLSCDNVARNGDATRSIVGSAPGVAFRSSVADRITPASDDPLVVVTEPFSLWVVEEFPGPRPAWERAGALIVPDTRPYEAMKLRLVNATHSALAALGLPRGHETVADAIADPSLLDFVRRLLAEELVPTVPPVPRIDLDAFVSQMLERFANPRLGHRLLQIAAGAEHKIPQRFDPPAAELRAAGRSTALIERVVAAAIPQLSRLPAGAAEDTATVDALVRLVNEAYAAGEAGLWIDGAMRIDGEQMAEAIRAGEMLVATEDGRIVGCARLRPLGPDIYDVGLVTADPRTWGSGIGGKLVATAEDLARAEGATTMQLELLVPREGTHPAKERLRDWYTRLGYAVVSTEMFETFVPHAAPELAAPCDVLIFHKPLRGSDPLTPQTTKGV